jgi:hypothetical protein
LSDLWPAVPLYSFTYFPYILNLRYYYIFYVDRTTPEIRSVKISKKRAIAWLLYWLSTPEGAADGRLRFLPSIKSRQAGAARRTTGQGVGPKLAITSK